MSYSTVEAYLTKSQVTFTSDFFPTEKTQKILITFIEEPLNYELQELGEGEVTEEILNLSEQVLKKDKKLFTNI